jgi:hypothetical protein
MPAATQICELARLGRRVGPTVEAAAHVERVAEIRRRIERRCWRQAARTRRVQRALFPATQGRIVPARVPQRLQALVEPRARERREIHVLAARRAERTIVGIALPARGDFGPVVDDGDAAPRVEEREREVEAPVGFHGVRAGSLGLRGEPPDVVIV